MSLRLAQLLGEAEEAVAARLRRLEQSYGSGSEDVRMLAETNQSVRRYLSRLGLDPEDTTPQELFHRLSARYQDDSRRLEQALGINRQSNLESKVKTAIELSEHCLADIQSLFLKKAVARRMLAELKPVKIKKLLGYRTLDSMLKRQNLATIYASLSQTESASWLIKFQKQLKKLGTDACELRTPTVVGLDRKVFRKTAPDKITILTDRSFGVLGVYDSQSYPDIPLMSLTLRILEAAEQLAGRSLLPKIAQLHPAVHFWGQADHLAAWLDGEVVSFNLFDVDKNHQAGDAFEQRTYTGAAKHFWQELVVRAQSAKQELTRPLRPAEDIVIAGSLDNSTSQKTAVEDEIASEVADV